MHSYIPLHLQHSLIHSHQCNYMTTVHKQSTSTTTPPMTNYGTHAHVACMKFFSMVSPRSLYPFAANNLERKNGVVSKISCSLAFPRGQYPSVVTKT